MTAASPPPPQQARTPLDDSRAASDAVGLEHDDPAVLDRTVWSIVDWFARHMPPG